jgi:futalosine hydrolase
VKVLVVTASELELGAINAALPEGTADVIAGGIGPAASAAIAAAALGRTDYDLVLSAGIGGGFAPMGIADIAVASTIAFADLGVESPDGFRPLTSAVADYPVEPKLAVELADRAGGRLGTIVTVATVTGTAQTADGLLERYPDAVAEAMEGAGVAAAARVHGVAFGEIRAISNPVGPRDRDAWRIPEALDALGRALAAVLG